MIDILFEVDGGDENETLIAEVVLRALSSKYGLVNVNSQTLSPIAPIKEIHTSIGISAI